METSLPTAGRRANDLPRIWYRLLAAIILLIMFALALTSMAGKAPTFDEQGFIVRGLAYLRGHTQIRVGHPLGLNALNAALLAGDGQVALPLDDPSWSGSSFHRPAELFLWEIGNDVARIMFLARLPTILLALLLAALAARWAGELSRQRWTALLALLFIALDPNVLAVARLATTDLGLTALALFAGYMLWRFLKQPSWLNVLLAGAALGLLQNTKFTAMLYIPLFGLLILVWLLAGWRAKARADNGGLLAAVPWRETVMVLVAYPLAALATLWATNGFEIGTLPPDLPVLPQLSGLTLPLANHLEQLLDIGGRLQVRTPSFLLGQYSDSGWWYYFPVSYLLKTPLPTLLLVGWGIAAYTRCLFRRQQACPDMLDSLALLVPSLGYFAIALTSDINLGYRHILPVLPFLVVFAAAAVSRSRPQAALARRAALLGLSAWLALAALWIYPNFLAFFNLLAGGPQRGWQALVDSNLDWGQDLDDLAPWMAANGVEQVWLSYFGEARPDYYGVQYRGLDSFPPRLMDPEARPFYPLDPAPGVYAISATNLQGVHFTDHDQFAWFRDRQPIDHLGHSILLYEVPADGEPADLVLAGLQMDELSPALYGLLKTNDVRPRWIDPAQSWIIPAAERAWWARPKGEPLHPLLASFVAQHGQIVKQGDDQEMGRYNAPFGQDTVLARFADGQGIIDLQRVQVTSGSGTDVTLLTTWRQVGQQQPLQIFVHALDGDGRIIAQWDGLGAAWQGWQAGDTLLQVHTLNWPEDETPQRLILGLYDPQTGQRWQTEDGRDFVEVP